MESIVVKLKEFDSYFQRNSTQSEEVRFLQRIVKLNEEVGELCEAALCEVDPDQRKKSKVVDFDAELADVIITALMLSLNRDKDVTVEINKKLDTILSRVNNS